MNRLIGAAGGGFVLVLADRVGGHSVAGAGLRGTPVLRCSAYVCAADRDRALGGDEAAFGRRAALVVVELPADLPAGVGAEQAGDLGLVLEGVRKSVV